MLYVIIVNVFYQNKVNNFHAVYTGYIDMLESYFQNFKTLINGFCKSKTECMTNKVKTSYNARNEYFSPASGKEHTDIYWRQTSNSLLSNIIYDIIDTQINTIGLFI